VKRGLAGASDGAKHEQIPFLVGTKTHHSHSKQKINKYKQGQIPKGGFTPSRGSAKRIQNGVILYAGCVERSAHFPGMKDHSDYKTTFCVQNGLFGVNTP
jgi:hypothetical protein